MASNISCQKASEDDTSWLPKNGEEEVLFGLEMQHPWSKHLLDGKKTIEVRNYTLPTELLGRKVFIIESRPGQDGLSALGDRIEFPGHHANNDSRSESSCQIRGWCKFGSIKEYISKECFQEDEAHHLVSPKSGYAWKEGKTSILYGWVVEQAQRSESSGDPFRVAVRQKRSIFRLYIKESDVKK